MSDRINFPREYEGWDIDTQDPKGLEVELAGSLPDPYDPWA